jgi:hypothetical protein
MGATTGRSATHSDGIVLHGMQKLDDSHASLAAAPQASYVSSTSMIWAEPAAAHRAARPGQ